jgi:hypothetical protein
MGFAKWLGSTLINITLITITLIKTAMVQGASTNVSPNT